MSQDLDRSTAAKPSESTEEYLEALWLLDEAGDSLARISSIAHSLKVAPPSVVEMLKKLERKGYVTYETRRGIKLADKGRRIARRIIRNHRLAEVLMHKTLHTEIDEETACGVEHHMTEQFADALCTLLDHPQTCPHGKEIPLGSCCRRSIKRL